MAEIQKIVYAFIIMISVILGQHSLIPCKTNMDCAKDVCLNYKFPTCVGKKCYCLSA
ncbi:putative Late nodulin [Medicago truncatula]|uniref:Nodule Cysteine-Rich (NCR) secreted peptide n=1 Tax=Medicago truncatula TaxID=3880 RepID=A0A072VAZ7_MEDTR|nr:Nodule Cysteine-Rich (NCR) secreted peptide [Medicago truncatula]RHN75402.1 putative Late nodulin [Medicago truncatula]